ncbi:hypothetical protein B0H13DRAFT_2367416 [Mycena leptocephala]|nr:hypothetical protein B0H13DRAFT_2367416 [Mycena leptocephala]
MPEVICDKVSATQKDWTTFTDAIKGIDRVHIWEGAAKAKKNQEIERTVRELATRDKTRQTPMTPVSKMSTQLAQAALTTPRANTAPPASTDVGICSHRRLIPQRTAEEMVKLKEIAEKLGRALLKDDAQGRAEYVRRVTIWETAYAGTRPRLELVGYLLSPGTAAPGSGECFSCGKVTTPRHRSSECTAAKIPRKESMFRGLVNKYIRTNPVQVNAVADWIDFEDTVEEDFPEGSSE